MPREWSSSLDTPDAILLVRLLAALGGSAHEEWATAIPDAMASARPGQEERHLLTTADGELDLSWRWEDDTTTDVALLGPPDLLGVVDDLFEPDDPTLTSELVYRHAVARWSDRELVVALPLLQVASAYAQRDPFDAWGPAIDRAIAQIALDLDRPDIAAVQLIDAQLDPISAFQHCAIASRAHLLQGSDDEAASAVGAGYAFIMGLDLREVPDLMNAAIGMALSGDVLCWLGYGASAARLAEHGLDNVRQAGVDDPTVVAMLTVVLARASGLLGDAEAASAALARVDRSLDPDLDVQCRAEEARAAWRAGDRPGAEDRYDDAIGRAVEASLPSVARLLTAERAAPAPPAARPEDAPLEQWSADTLSARLAEVRPYAVVVSITRPLEVASEIEALAASVERLLGASPELGFVDGTGSDGHTWDLHLDGEDPERLWAAVTPLVADAGLAGRGTVRLRTPDGVEERPLPTI